MQIMEELQDILILVSKNVIIMAMYIVMVLQLAE